MRRHVGVWLLTFCILSLVTACLYQKKDQNDETPLLQAYRLIDANRNDEAIAVLENALKDEPDNKQYKVALASAYANKVGINVRAFVPLINAAKGMQELSDESTNIEYEKTPWEKVDQVTRISAGMLLKVARFFQVYASIPTVTRTESYYLTYAVDLLDSIEDIEPGDAAYRAVLKVVLFKNAVATDLIGSAERKSFADKQACSFTLDGFNETIAKLGDLIIDILEDVARIQPSKEKEINAARERVSSSVSALTLSVNSLMLSDEISRRFLTNTTLQLGFRKLLKCEDGGDGK